MRDLTIPLGERASGWVALERRALVVQRGRGLHRRDPRVWDLDGRGDDAELSALRSAAIAPLVTEDRCLGALALYADAERRFTRGERRTLVTVAGHVARAMRRADPAHPAFLESLTDPLTGLPNARYLEISAADLTPGVTECGNGFGLLAFRVREFEKACQRLGILAAERLLAVLARRLAAGCRPSEVPVRFGPDLFLVLCPTADPHRLVRRWDALLRSTETGTIELRPGHPWRARLASAHASCPADGTGLAALLDVLADRLAPSADRPRRVVPFRVAGSAGA